MLWHPSWGTPTDYLRRKLEDKPVKFTNNKFGIIGLVGKQVENCTVAVF
jgi:hypothetical protein